MLDIEFKLNGLKDYLYSRGITMEHVKEIVNLAKQDVENTINDIVSNAIAEARMIGGEDFAKRLTTMKEGTEFRIIVDDNTDFSEPPFPMLPKISENISKNIHKENNTNNTNSQTTFTNIFDMRESANRQRRAEMEQRRAQRREARKDSTFIGSLSTNGLEKARTLISPREQEVQDVSNIGNTPDEPSNNQTPDNKRKIDEKQTLYDINNKMNENISRAITAIIDQYRGLV